MHFLQPTGQTTFPAFVAPGSNIISTTNFNHQTNTLCIKDKPEIDNLDLEAIQHYSAEAKKLNLKGIKVCFEKCSISSEKVRELVKLSQEGKCKLINFACNNVEINESDLNHLIKHLDPTGIPVKVIDHYSQEGSMIAINDAWIKKSVVNSLLTFAQVEMDRSVFKGREQWLMDSLMDILEIKKDRIKALDKLKVDSQNGNGKEETIREILTSIINMYYEKVAKPDLDGIVKQYREKINSFNPAII